jgi:hypothetical protein
MSHGQGAAERRVTRGWLPGSIPALTEQGGNALTVCFIA